MENNSLRGRFSLSSSNLTSPIAESTCLNGSSSHTKFNWGEGTMSSKNRNNSRVANNSGSMSKKVNGTPPKVTMSPASRIDPRTYVDIHSNGLASRIVKYHDNSTRMNRSLSMGNLYNKPGQFPVVHLKKNEQQYKAKKSRNLSITRIAAPEKSVFHGNTLSSILRSGSIVGMQKSDEEISRENRPILHPPPTENEMAPTRSVLEVLKEISRKRIISDELDGTELIKKHCKEPDYDTTPYNNIQKNQTKRQREMSTTTASNVQLSPEQVVKKRMCTYNNDILSSLSSSMMSMTKKKMMTNTQTQKRTASDLGSSSNLSPGSKDTEPMRSEKQHRIGTFDLDQMAQTNKYIPITPLPNTPEQGIGIANDFDNRRAGIVTRRASEPAIRSTKPKLTLFNKDYDEEAPPTRDEVSEPAEGDLCGIQFVKPKKSSSVSSGGALLMEKTQKSKLALMLSGLKGELNEEDEIDAPPPKVEQKKDAVSTLPVISVPSSTPAAISFGTTTTAVTTESSRPVTTPAQVSAKIDFALPTSTTASTAEEKKTPTSDVVTSTAPSSATVSLPAPTPKVSVPATTPSIPTLPAFSFGLNKPTVTTAAVTATTTPSVSPQSTLIQAAPVVSSASATTLPALTLGTQPFSFGLATTQSPTTASKSAAPTFTFGAPTTSLSNTQPPSFGNATTTTTAPKADVPPPVFGQSSAAAQPAFSFGSLAAQSKTESTTAVTTTAATTSVPTFNFGAPKTDWNSSTNKQQNSSKIEPIAFGNNATTSLNPQPIPTLSSTPSTGGFAFAVSTANEAPKSLFTSTFPTTTTPSNLNTTFSFSANKEVAAQPNTTFTFGSAAAPQAAAATASAPAQPSMFGSTTPVKPSNSFGFGAAAPAAPVKAAFSFSSGDNPPVTTASNPIGGFSFNSATANTAPMQESSQNIFGSAASTVKPAFSFGSTPAAGTQPNDKPPVFGASTVKTTNLFGAAPTTTTVQSSPFTFGAPTTSSTNLFGGATAAAPNTNPTPDLSANSSSSGSIFGGPSAAAAPLQQSSTFTFGSTSNNPVESNKPAGGFVFGSSSSIGSNASKPSSDLNKTFVFGDGSTTTITPAPAPVATNLFGGNNAATTGTTDNKLFSFGGAPNAGNTTFGGSNPAPVFSFGATPPAANPGQNTNSFAPTGGPQNPLAPTDRPIRKAMRRLHKT